MERIIEHAVKGYGVWHYSPRHLFRKIFQFCFHLSRLVDGQYWTVSGVEWKDGWPQLQLEGEDGRGEVAYDPPTFMRISRTPLVPDEYEQETVVVGLSSVPGAGEGLFARLRQTSNAKNHSASNI